MAIHYLIILFLSSCLLSVFYWQVVQPILLRGLRYRLFARRDKLRRLAINRKEDHTSFAYHEVENFICKTIAVVPAVSLVSFIWFVIRNSNIENDEYKQLRKEASTGLLELTQKTVCDALLIMFLNSPILTLVSALVALGFWVVGRINRLVIFRKAEVFIDELPNYVPNNSIGIKQPA